MKKRHGRRQRRFSARTPYDRSRTVERLEPRWVLSASGGASNAGAPWADSTALGASTSIQSLLTDRTLQAELGLETIEWQGETTLAFEREWIVGFDLPDADRSPSFGSTTAMTMLADFDTTFDVIKDLGTPGTMLVETSADMSYESLTTMLATVPGFRYAEPNFLLYEDATFPNDVSFGNLYGLHNTGQSGGTADADIDAPEAWDFSTGSGDIVIGVIDSGVDYTHPDLAANMWTNPGEIAGDGIDNDGNGFIDDVYGWDFRNDDSDPFDDRGHGTHVSGTIAAVGNNGIGVTGVNWNAQIMALKYLGSDGHGNTANAVAALNYATMMKRDYGVNVVLTSNSWGGGGFSTALRDAIAASGSENMLFVAAAGNDNVDTDIFPHYPSSYDLDNIISVAATDRNDDKASFSSFGLTTVDLAAPGVTILSTVPGGSYANYNGTSMATPHVAGVAALLYDMYPGATRQQIKAAILDGVDAIPAMAGITVTGGRLNALGAVEAMGMQVQSTSPATNEVVTVPPTVFTVDFSHPFDADTVDAADFAVNGIPADMVEFLGLDLLEFRFNVSPVSTEGPQTMTIQADSIERSSDGDGIAGFNHIFRYDTLRMEVTSTAPTDGSMVTLPLETIEVHLNEDVLPGSVGLNDLVLSQGHVTGFTIVDENTIQYEVAGISNDGILAINMAAGALTDEFGNPMLPYTGTLVLDAVQVAAKPFERLAPLGGLLFASYDNPGLVNSPSDEDDFTFFLEAGETIAAVVTPEDPSVTLSVELVGFGPPISAGAPGEAVVLPVTAIGANGSQIIRIRGNGFTPYKVDLYRDASVEAHDTSGGNALAIDASFLTLGSGRYAVVGRSDPTYQTIVLEPDNYANNTILNTVLPGVTLSDPVAGGSIRAVTSSFTAPTGTRVFGSPVSGDNGWRETASELRANFAELTNYVSIAAGSDDSSDRSFLRAYAADGTLLAEVQSQPLSSGQSQILSIQRPTAEVAYAIAAGIGGDVSPLDRLEFNVGIAEVDVYTLDLTGAVGSTIDILLAGHNGTDFSNAVLELIGPGGGAPLAVATSDPLGVDAKNLDLAILDYVVNEPGVYSLRITSDEPGEYGLVVTHSLVFDSEANDLAGDPLRNLDGVGSALGAVDHLPVQGSFEFVVDPGQSTVSISGALVDPFSELSIPIQEQLPGSLETQLGGYVRAAIGPGTIQFLEDSAIDAFEQPGPFLPGGLPADLAGRVPFLPGVEAVAAIRDAVFSGFSLPITVAPNGEFPSDQVTMTTVAGLIAAEVPGFLSDTLEIDGLFLENMSAIPSMLEFDEGEMRLTLHVDSTVILHVPETLLLVEFNISSTIVAMARIPTPEDIYEVTLSEGESILVTTETLLDDPSTTPLNTLDPRLEIRDAGGNLLAFDDDSADGKNASLGFEAPAAGTYQIVVRAASGFGEYLLDYETVDNLAPTLDPIGAQAIDEGATLSFTATASDPNAADHLTFSLGPGAPLGANIDPETGLFTWTPNDNLPAPVSVTIIVTDDGTPTMQDSETIEISVNSVAPTVDIQGPSSGVRGQPRTFTLVVDDPAPADAAENFGFVIDWNGDGTFDELRVGPSGMQVTHVFVQSHNYQVRVAAVDKDSHLGPEAVHPIEITNFALQADEEHPELVNFVWGGTQGDDVVYFLPRIGLGSYTVALATLNGQEVNQAYRIDGVTGRIIAYGQNGDDSLVAEFLRNAPTELHGGNGDDLLVGGFAGNRLFGENGHDILIGGTRFAEAGDWLEGGNGRDLLFGHRGPDTLIGGQGSDLLAGGIHAFNPLLDNLAAIQQAWLAQATYASRIAAVSAILPPQAMSFDDAAVDTLLGGSDLDWFLLSLADDSSDAAGPEIETDI